MIKVSFATVAAGMLLAVPGVAFAQSDQPTAGPAATPAPAPASAPAVQLGADGKIVLAEGTPVVDTQGGAVGTLVKIEKGPDGQPSNVVLKTTNSEVMIPAASLARTEKHALIAMTAAQIDAAAAAARGNQPSSQAPAGGQSSSEPAATNPAS